MRIIILHIMKHNLIFLVRLGFRLHSFCAVPLYFPAMWQWSFTLRSSFIYCFLQIQSLLHFFSHNKNFIRLSNNLLQYLLSLVISPKNYLYQRKISKMYIFRSSTFINSSHNCKQYDLHIFSVWTINFIISCKFWYTSKISIDYNWCF